MKNIFSLMILILFLALIFLGKGFYYSHEITDVYNVFNTFEGRLSNRVIDNYSSTDPALKKEAELIIKKQVLKDLELDNWMEYIDYIKINLYPLNIVDNSQKELIISLTLSKDSGVLGIYKSLDDKYIYTNKIEDITMIKNIYSVKIPTTKRHFIIVEEFLDESFGAYFTDNFLRAFTLIDGRYTEVFRESIEYIAYYNKKWYDPSLEQNLWYKLSEDNIIDYLIIDDKDLKFNILKNIAKYKGINSGNDDIPEEFIPIEQREFKYTSIWSEDYKYFIIGKGKVKDNSKIVGIIENYSHSVDSLLNLSQNYYKVIYKNGKIDYINKDNLIIYKD